MLPLFITPIAPLRILLSPSIIISLFNRTLTLLRLDVSQELNHRHSLTTWNFLNKQILHIATRDEVQNTHIDTSAKSINDSDFLWCNHAVRHKDVHSKTVISSHFVSSHHI